jgi:hypothetical protein
MCSGPCSASRATSPHRPTQSFTQEPGSTLHVGGVGKNRIGKPDATDMFGHTSTLNAKVKRREIRERRVAAPADALKRVAQSDARQPGAGLRAAGPSHPKKAAATLTTSDALFNEDEL